MQEMIEDNILRKIDPKQSYLWKWIPSRGKIGGMLSGINMEYFDVGSYKEEKYTLRLNLWDKERKLKWNFINVYEAAQDEHKQEFLAELAGMISSCQDSVLIGGDFNIIRFSSDQNKKGGSQKHSKLFNSVINTYDLVDLQMTGGRYTWSNNQENPTLEKLDRYLSCKAWEMILPLALVYKMPREHSDHNPIIISTTNKQPLKI
jgi:exonuclease III